MTYRPLRPGDKIEIQAASTVPTDVHQFFIGNRMAGETAFSHQEKIFWVANSILPRFFQSQFGMGWCFQRLGNRGWPIIMMNVHPVSACTVAGFTRDSGNCSGFGVCFFDLSVMATNADIAAFNRDDSHLLGDDLSFGVAM